MLSSPLVLRRTLFVALAVAMAGCGTQGSTDRQVLSADTSVYAVLEVVPREGVGLEQDRVGPTRVIAVDWVPAVGIKVRGPDEDFAVECGRYQWNCSQLASERGALLLRTTHTAPLEAGALQAWPEGETRELKGWRLDFHALDGTPLMRLIPAEGKDGARAEVRLVKKCSARISRVRNSRLEGTGSGVIAVPARVRRSWVELERPSCFAPEDVQPVL
ncbi:MAG TPA: hypothetical protein VE153_13710 [Myxococcus sp.]|nr:hypothetical protein [Myxococcus sp.]